MKMGRPPKSHLQIVTEKKSHRTKAELETREKAEKALLTGISLKEWPGVKADPVAHKEFQRLKKLLKAIDKDDDLHEGVINRYCQLHSECQSFEILKRNCKAELQELHEAKAQGEIDFMTYLDRKESIHSRFLALDKKIMEKRKMMLSIEKENIMTIASALRAIPKKPKEEADDDPMAALLRKAGGK